MKILKWWCRIKLSKYHQGLLSGAITGALSVGIVTGFIEASQELIAGVQFLGTFTLILAFLITFFRFFRRKKTRSYILSPYLDGFISAFGFTSKLYSVAVFGFSFP